MFDSGDLTIRDWTLHGFAIWIIVMLLGAVGDLAGRES
jgi:hypothetical protein